MASFHLSGMYPVSHISLKAVSNICSALWSRSLKSSLSISSGPVALCSLSFPCASCSSACVKAAWSETVGCVWWLPGFGGGHTPALAHCLF